MAYRAHKEVMREMPGTVSAMHESSREEKPVVVVLDRVVQATFWEIPCIEKLALSKERHSKQIQHECPERKLNLVLVLVLITFVFVLF